MAADSHCPNCKAPIPSPRPKGCPHCNTILTSAPAAAATPVVEPESGGLTGFLRENWVWIVAPIAIALVLVVVLALVFGGDDSSPFIYNIF